METEKGLDATNRKLTKVQKGELEYRAFEVYTEIKQRLGQQALTYLETGRLLKMVRDERLYRYMGEGGFETYTDFLNNPEISVSRASAYSYIRVYELYIEKLGMSVEEVQHIPLGRLIGLAPILRKKSYLEAKEEVLQMGALTHTDYLQQRTEKGYEPEKPQLFMDKATGKYVLEFREFNMLKIYNKDTKEVIYESRDNDLPHE